MSIPRGADSSLSPFRGLSRPRPILPGLCLFAAILVAYPTKSFSRTIFTHWSISESQPNIRQGGRANTFAIHPTDNNIIIVASETGGLFRSTHRGAKWRHVDSLPCFRTNSVAFVPSNPNIVLVTTVDDFKAVGGGGIWRSTDGGVTWAQSAVTFPAGITGRLSGYEISIAPDSGVIYVATTFGILMSSNDGADWVYRDVFGAGSDRRTFSVVALGDNRVIAGGLAGVRRSVDGGEHWTPPAAGVGGVAEADIHALGRSPHSRQHAYIVNSDTSLFHTEDGGNNWSPITAAPSGGVDCGGIGFIKVVSLPRRRELHLYFSNRCGVARLVATINSLTGNPSHGGAWQHLVVDHGDTRDIAFDGASNPLLLGTDGGLHKTIDGGANWSYIGGGRDGYNALQVTEIKGQYIEDIGRYDLYFGTQDNDLWASGDGGLTWTFGMCCEGFFIEAQRRVATSSHSKITNVACSGCGNHISDPLFTNIADWLNPAGDLVGNPMIVRRSMHLQGVNDSGGFSRGMAVTGNLGASWRQFATFAEDRRDLPKLGRPGDSRISSIVYQAYHAPGWYEPGGFEINHLMRIHKSSFSPIATVFYPAMNGFGGLGINPTMFAWYLVFAVDPGDPFHVMAPDVINQRVMETRDGGENWTEVTELTNLATNGGRLLFRSSIVPIITAISFSPQDPRLVLAGTSEGGIYLSTDNGVSWERIANSERVTCVTGFGWLNVNDVMVSTYGRGLWRLQNRLVIPRPDRFCDLPCSIRRIEPDPAPFDRAILIYEGRVLGARAGAGSVREVFVTPGSSVVFAGGDQKWMLEVKVTRTNHDMGFRGFKSQPGARQGGEILTGLVLGKDNRLAGAVFAYKPMVMISSESGQERGGQTKSPLANKPHLQIVTKRFDGGPTVAPGEVIQVVGTNFPRGAVLEIMIDKRPANDKIPVDGQGAISAQMGAPRGMGLHSLVIRLADGQKTVLDGSMFLVKHIDEGKSRKRKGK